MYSGRQQRAFASGSIPLPSADPPFTADMMCVEGSNAHAFLESAPHPPLAATHFYLSYTHTDGLRRNFHLQDVLDCLASGRDFREFEPIPLADLVERLKALKDGLSSLFSSRRSNSNVPLPAMTAFAQAAASSSSSVSSISGPSKPRLRRANSAAL